MFSGQRIYVLGPLQLSYARPLREPLYVLYRPFTRGSTRIPRQIDSFEIPTLDKREEIRSKASNQDGGLDLDSHLHVLFLSCPRDIGGCHERLLAVNEQAFGVEIRSHRGSHLEPPRVITRTARALKIPAPCSAWREQLPSATSLDRSTRSICGDTATSCSATLCICGPT